MKANLLRAAVLAIAAATASSCTDSRMIPPGGPDAAAPASRPATIPTPPLSGSDWRDMSTTAGDWSWSAAGGESVARFAGGRLVLRCDRASHTVRIERNEPSAPLSGPALLTVSTQTQTRTFQALAQSGTVAVSFAARDPLLDAMAFSKGRFVVTVAGMAPLSVPSWTEVSRVIEDCR